jgi:hypothetical protein
MFLIEFYLEVSALSLGDRALKIVAFSMDLQSQNTEVFDDAVRWQADNELIYLLKWV